MPLPRPCTKCGKRFQPKGKKERVCDVCLKDIKNVNFIKLICRRKGITLNKLNNIW